MAIDKLTHWLSWMFRQSCIELSSVIISPRLFLFESGTFLCPCGRKAESIAQPLMD